MFGFSLMLARKGGLSALATIAALGFAVSASAQITHSLPMTGQWFQNRGPNVDIPVNGGPVACTPDNPATGCIVGRQPSLGGIPDAGGQSLMITVGATPNDPARFTIPTSAFGQALGTQNGLIPNVASVVQLDTHFTVNGPGAETGGPNVDRVFEKNAWVLQGPASGRLGKTFAWCPNYAGPPPCPNPAVRPGGPESGLVRYSNPAGNGFGGTMAMIQRSGPSGTGVEPGTVWVGRPTPGGMFVLINQPFGFLTAPQHPGRGYASYDPDNLSSGPIYFGFMTSLQTPGQTGLSGPNAGQGFITSMGFTLPTVNPADTNLNFGFPWTTGKVEAQNIQSTMFGAPGTTYLTATGSDNRTQAGAGTITLVAGGTTHRLGAVADFAALDIVTMTVPEPGAALALGLSLAAIGGLYRMRRRF